MVRYINHIFLTLIGVACYLPKIYIFTDTLLLPKWYPFLFALLLWMLLGAVVALCSDNWRSKDLASLDYAVIVIQFMGDAFRMKRKYSDAIPHYDLAHNMCPARLAPLEGLYLAYGGMDDHKNRTHIARMISEQKIKVPSYDAYRIKQNYK